MSSPDLSLEQLFAEAKAAMKVQRRAAFEANNKSKSKSNPEVVDSIEQTLFTDPANWIDRGGVALIHRESQTLLGNFQVLQHRVRKDLRRLIRSTSPIAVSGVEEVDFGYEPPEQLPTSSPRAETQVIRTLDLALEAPALSARSVIVCVHYYNGWTSRVVLTEPTTFSAQGELLQLPAGVDILPVLQKDSRRAVRYV